MDLHEADPKRFDASVNTVAALSARVPEVLGKHYEITYPGRQWQTGHAASRPCPCMKDGCRQKPISVRFSAMNGRFISAVPRRRNSLLASLSGLIRSAPKSRSRGSAAAITELSSFGKFDVTGTDAEAALDRIMTASMKKQPGRVMYSLMLNDAGGIESDLTILRLADDHYQLTVGSGAEVKRDYAWISNHLPSDASVTLTDRSQDLASLGLMGPQVAEIALKLGGDWMHDLGYFRHASGMLAGVEVLAARLSYIGSYGWELTCARDDVVQLYDALADAGGQPIGSFAMTAMRIEKRFLSYGHDLDTDMIPAMAGLDFAVAMDGGFIGREALREKPVPSSRLVTLKLDDADAQPIGNEPVMQDGQMIGKVTSAAYGYRVGRPVALALIETDLAGDGQQVMVNIAGEQAQATVIDGAAFDLMAA